MGRPPRIDRRAVLAAGLAIADQRGLAAVTMQAVADRLEVTPMALYRHVADKADLVDGLVEVLLTESPLPPTDRPWRERLSGLADDVRATAGRHPDVFVLLLQRPATTPASRRIRDAVVMTLVEAGLAPGPAARVERLVSTAVLGYAASEAAGRFRRQPRAERDADFSALKEMLVRFVEGAAGHAGPV